MESISGAAVYSDNRILQEIEEGHIIIKPFHQEQLNNCSYNITLSEHFFREVPIQMEDENFGAIFLNPWSENHISSRWQPGKVESATSENAEDLGLQEGDKYIYLHPLETILVASQEFVGARGHITAMIKGRSSCGRSLLSICGGAGWGDVGYINRWTLMITNNSRFATTILPVGKSVAQIIFLEVGYPTKEYKGKYQHQADDADMEKFLEELEKKWSPRMMLPQAYRDTPEDNPVVNSEGNWVNPEEVESKPTIFISEHSIDGTTA